MFVGEPHKGYDPQGHIGQLRLMCHPKLKNGLGAWEFKDEENNLEENNLEDERKSRCFIMRCLSCHIDRSFR